VFIHEGAGPVNPEKSGQERGFGSVRGARDRGFGVKTGPQGHPAGAAVLMPRPGRTMLVVPKRESSCVSFLDRVSGLG
jgi:hypothetical protein